MNAPRESDDADGSVAAARRFVSSFLAAQSAYHDHKETVAYTGIAAYLSGSAWLIFERDPPWQSLGIFRFSVLLTFLVTAAVVGWWFVAWQLRQRREAAVDVAAAYDLLGEWLTRAPHTGLELGDRDVANGIRWPTLLEDARRSVRTQQQNALRPIERRIHFALAVFTVTALIHLVCSAPERWRTFVSRLCGY